ncbi:activating transcription factor 7-interacting protein 1 isoform X2 [Anabrus simplex]|uniref:activating transcription factor 7-interacting protein 1 isoform X2 n=1 Tax=Anabrus simplex TaxID=316456 RepID=UPI0034DD5520
MGRSSTIPKRPGPMPCAVPFVPISMKLPPPRPELRLELADNLGEPGIILKWNLCLTPQYEEIDFYELYARQEIVDPPSASGWKKFGVIQALPLPMACTLVQFKEGNYYHFAVRAVDVLMRFGPFSSSSKIQIPPKVPNSLKEVEPMCWDNSD